MEGIYLIHTRELFTLKKEIYKIGRSKNLKKRVKQYPKDSKLLLIKYCNNSKLCESKIIKLFKVKFIQNKYYGNEYFEGSKEEMIELICEFINSNKYNILKTSFINKNNENNENNENNKIIKNKKVSKNVSILKCPKCEDIFKYPSLIKRHLKTSVRCCIPDEDIDKVVNPNKNKISCSKCNKVFTRNSSLIRHNKESKCSKK